MRFNKQILEAVNRGIQLALDDYQDDELNGSLSPINDVIDSEDIIKQRIELDKISVDLGLPSGTRWAKYNLGCDYDLLNNNPEDFEAKNWHGDYYAWGELKPNVGRKWENYKFCKGGDKQLIKYCTDSNDGFIGFNDGLDQLLPEDDIATITLGSHFHIPTKEQWEELIKFSNWVWTENYAGIRGLNGNVIYSTINHNKIFIPRYDQYNEYCFSMSANISKFLPCRFWMLTASKDDGNPQMTPISRTCLVPIRPVYNK